MEEDNLTKENSITQIDIEDIDMKPSPSNLSEYIMDKSYDSKTGKYVYNKWSSINENTVKAWKKSIERSTFIYEIILEKYKTKLNWVMILTLIISSISTLISAISAAIAANNGKDYIYLIFGLSIIVTLLSATTAILSGIIKITKWDKTVNTLSQFIEKLDKFYAIISSELLLPDKLRKNAITFIPHYNAKYLTLFRNSPNVNRSEYEYASHRYTQYLANNNSNCWHAHQFANTDVVIDII